MTDTSVTTDGTPAPATRTTARRRPWLVALAVGAACAVCLVPGLVLGGALAGVGAAVVGWWWVAGPVSLATVAVVVLRRRRPGRGATCEGGAC